MKSYKPFLLAIVSVCVLAATAAAQSDVALRFLLVPKIGTGTGEDIIRPKYIRPLGTFGAPYVGIPRGFMDYGAEDLMLVAVELTAAELSGISANPDVLVVPANLDNNVSALALNTIQTKLEASNLPAEWVTTALTYRQVLGRVMRVIFLAQRYQTLFGRIFSGAISLDTRMNQLTQAQRQRLLDLAADLGVDSSSATSTTTLRQVLRAFADQMNPNGLVFGGETF